MLDSRTTSTGKLTLTSPYATSATSIVFAENSTAGGRCTTTCGATVSLAAGTPFQCPVTCDNDVIGYTASVLINNVPFTTGYVPITVQTNPTDFVSTVLSDTFAVNNGGSGNGWSGNQILLANGTTGVTTWSYPFTTTTPAANSSQCATFDTYAVDNTATLRTRGLNAAITSVTATATAPCLQPSFGNGTGNGTGTGNASASGSIVLQRYWSTFYSW